MEKAFLVNPSFQCVLTFFSVFQEECDEFRKKVKDGIFKKLTVVSFFGLYFDITITLKHSLDVII